jgi:3-deoxy-D-manno-octulosonic acid kinase
VTGRADPTALRRAYAVPDAVRLRVAGRDVLAWVDGAEEAAQAVAVGADDLPVAASTGRAPLRRVESPLGPLLVRESRKGGALRRLRGRRFLGRVRPLDELVLARRLLAARVPVVEAVAAVALGSPLGWRGFLVTREVRGGLDLQSWLYAREDHPHWPARDVLAAAGRAVRALHDAGVEHADLHGKNLLLDPDTAGARVVDLDRARPHDAPLSERERLGNLVRFARSVEKHRLRGMRVGRRDALRFLAAYAGDAEGGARWLEAVRAELRRGLALRVAWWRLTGQARPRATDARRDPRSALSRATA